MLTEEKKSGLGSHKASRKASADPRVRAKPLWLHIGQSPGEDWSGDGMGWMRLPLAQTAVLSQCS